MTSQGRSELTHVGRSKFTWSTQRVACTLLVWGLVFLPILTVIKTGMRLLDLRLYVWSIVTTKRDTDISNKELKFVVSAIDKWYYYV